MACCVLISGLISRALSSWRNRGPRRESGSLGVTVRSGRVEGKV